MGVHQLFIKEIILNVDIAHWLNEGGVDENSLPTNRRIDIAVVAERLVIYAIFHMLYPGFLGDLMANVRIF